MPWNNTLATICSSSIKIRTCRKKYEYNPVCPLEYTKIDMYIKSTRVVALTSVYVWRF